MKMMKVMTTAIAAGICAVCLGENVLKNPGFETVNENRIAAVWSGKHETVEENGSNALKFKTIARYGRFENDTSQEVEKVPGGNYILTGKVKGNMVAVTAVCRFTPPEGKAIVGVISIPKAQMRQDKDGWLSFTGKFKGPAAGSYKLFFDICAQVEKADDVALLDDLSLSPEQTSEKGK